MKTVTFVQVNYLYGNTAYLPYSAGVLAAYAWNHAAVQAAYRLGRFVFLREPVAQVLATLDEPFLLAFSSYIWNFEYNKALAKAVKERFPQCVIVFGGHHVSFDSPSLLEDCPYIDYLIHEEGEEAFTQLLLTLNSENAPELNEIMNLSWRDAQGSIHKNPNALLTCSDYPSPYLMGLFDDLFQQYSYDFSATLETNRGCPFHCAFCDWGTLRGKLRRFPMERIEAEIAWMAKQKIDHVYCADANFGIFPRDEQIVEKLIASKKQSGFPRKFRVCYTKNSDETVFALNQKLEEYGMSKGATLSFQSVCPQVLQAIGRENLTMERFRDLMALYNRAGIPSNSELIIALPNETYESFCAGVGALLEAGQHTSLNIYNCEMLPNSRMADAAYREEHGIVTVSTYLGRNHCESSEAQEVQERSDIICATKTMPQADWKEANLFAVFVQSYHCLGLLQCFAIYLFYEQDVSFSSFYRQLLEWMRERPETVAGKLFQTIARRLDRILEGEGSWSYINPLFGDIIWPFEEGVFLETLYRHEAFYTEMQGFLERFNMPEALFADLLRYQIAILKFPGKTQFDLRLYYDWQRYFSGIFRQEKQALRKQTNVIHLLDANSVENWADYAREIVWYGRKGGKNIYTKLDVEYD